MPSQLQSSPITDVISDVKSIAEGVVDCFVTLLVSAMSGTVAKSGSSGGLSALAPPHDDWESLRRQARQTESDIDARLVAYAKMASTPATSADRLADLAAQEIDELLRKLGDVIDAMTRIAGMQGSSAVQHALQRHREILYDYTNEYRKTRANLTAHREQSELLSSVRSDINAYKTSQRGEYLLSERQHVDRSNQMTNQIIEYDPF